MRLQGNVMLVLAAVSLLAMAYGVIKGELWPAAACALSALWALNAYRNDKRTLDRHQS
jgi:hypothetical protein